MCLLLSSCITVYQPLTAFNRPIAIDPGLANFVGVRVDVHCIPEDFLDRTGANLLCRKVETLLTNQGAKVQTFTERGRAFDEEFEENNAPADLVLELRARLLKNERNGILWVVSFATLTLLPAISEYTFAQDVTIRDATGFLLVKDSMQARFVRYFGVGTWALNHLLDWTLREDAEQLSGDVVKEDFSKAFYGQLTQLMFNANQRRRVLNAGSQSALAKENP